MKKKIDSYFIECNAYKFDAKMNFFVPLAMKKRRKHGKGKKGC